MIIPTLKITCRQNKNNRRNVLDPFSCNAVEKVAVSKRPDVGLNTVTVVLVFRDRQERKNHP